MAKAKTRGVKTDPNAVILAELTRLGLGHDGYIDPEVVVEAAAHPDNPMHRYFTWDDTEAARRYRIAQAGQLVRRVTLTILRPDPADPKRLEVRRVRAVQSSPPDRHARGSDEHTGSYMRVEKLMADPDKRRAMVRQTLVELEGIRKRRRELTELAEVWAAIDRAAGQPPAD